MKPKALLKKAAELEMPAVAITDTCNLYCAVTLYKEAKITTSSPFGSEIWMWPDGIEHRLQETQLLQPRTAAPKERRKKRFEPVLEELSDGGWHLCFLVENEDINLSKDYHAIYDGMHYSLASTLSPDQAQRWADRHDLGYERSNREALLRQYPDGSYQHVLTGHYSQASKQRDSTWQKRRPSSV